MEAETSLLPDWLRRPSKQAPLVQVGEARLPLVIRRLAHARRMTLRLAPDGREVRISIPRWGREAEALAFARSREAWLAGQLAALAPAPPIAPGAALPYRGEMLSIRHDPALPRRVAARDGAIRLGGPEEGIRLRLARWLQAEARKLFAEDLACYCARAGVAVPPLSLSSPQRRWGSCSARGAIRLNWRLVMAPDAVRRSVVAHEVAHLVHFDHSPRFHALLDEIFEDDVAAANRWLKQRGRSLYAPFG